MDRKDIIESQIRGATIRCRLLPYTLEMYLKTQNMSCARGACFRKAVQVGFGVVLVHLFFLF